MKCYIFYYSINASQPLVKNSTAEQSLCYFTLGSVILPAHDAQKRGQHRVQAHRQGAVGKGKRRPADYSRSDAALAQQGHRVCHEAHDQEVQIRPLD